MLSAFSVTSDLASCTRCTGMRTVSLEEFRQRVRGRPFRFLLRYHLRRHDEERLRRGLQGSLALLPGPARRLAREVGEEWAAGVRDGELADADCAELIDGLGDRVRSEPETSASAAADSLFDIFEVATLSVALEAREDEDLRAAIGDADAARARRRGWHLAAAVVLGVLLATTGGPVLTPVLWLGLGLAVLPPLADLVRARDGTGTRGDARIDEGS